MQTGVFYVRLNPGAKLSEDRVAHRGKSVFLGEIFTKSKPYPVLAVEYREASGGAKTLYHLPVDTNEIGWFPADLFVFARD
ncbi:MAG TPA: hypothetical protein VMV68_06705 [Spirochaetia bacterium]|nr:hypothetical protein [Spirochaetia bacterium]